MSDAERTRNRRYGYAVVAVAGVLLGLIAIPVASHLRRGGSSTPSPSATHYLSDEEYVRTSTEQPYCRHRDAASKLIGDLGDNKVTTREALELIDSLTSSMTTDADIAASRGYGAVAAKIRAHARAMSVLRQAIETSSTSGGGRLLNEYFTQASSASSLCPK